MDTGAFRYLYWGFLFVSLNFRIMGFNVLPDIIGYILFSLALGILASRDENFGSAKPFTYVLIFLSIFTIYEAPNQGVINPTGSMIGVISLILSLVVVYKLFTGIKQLADQQEEFEISKEAVLRWNQFFFLRIASLIALFLMVIPGLAFLVMMGLLIAGIVLTVNIMSLMAKCESQLACTDAEIYTADEKEGSLEEGEVNPRSGSDSDNQWHRL